MRRGRPTTISRPLPLRAGCVVHYTDVLPFDGTWLLHQEEYEVRTRPIVPREYEKSDIEHQCMH